MNVCGKPGRLFECKSLWYHAVILITHRTGTSLTLSLKVISILKMERGLKRLSMLSKTGWVGFEVRFFFNLASVGLPPWTGLSNSMWAPRPLWALWVTEMLLGGHGDWALWEFTADGTREPLALTPRSWRDTANVLIYCSQWGKASSCGKVCAWCMEG